MKIAVIGGGIAGTSLAFELHRNGINDITIFEKNDFLGTECSFANGGQISVCNAETWLTWKNIYKGIKWCFKKDAPLYFNPTPTPDKLLWLTGFLKNTALGYHEKNTIETIRLGLLSRSLYEQILTEQDRKKIGQTDCGMLHVYTNEQSFASGRASTDIFEGNGVEWIEVSASDIVAKDPNMANFKNLVGGFLTPSDTVADINSLTNLLGKHSYANVKTSCEVVGVFKFNNDKVLVTWEKDNEKFEEFYDHVVFANGHSVRKFAHLFGDFFNLYPVKGYSVTYTNPEAPPSFSLLDDDKKIVSSTFVYGKNKKSFRIAGTAELAGTNSDIRKVRTAPLHRWALDNFGIENSEYSEWACHRPMTSDMMPIYRESNTDRIWYHGGHGHLGLTLSMGTANILVKSLLQKYSTK